MESLRVAQLTLLSDEELMARLQEGGAEALAVLYDRYHRAVFAISTRIVRDRGEAEDVVQTVFLDVFRAVGQFDPAKGSTKQWILQYAYHRALSRKQYLNTRSFYTQESDDQLESRVPHRDAAFDGFNLEELKHLMTQGLATLSRPQRRVIKLASYEGLSMKEIAERTGESFFNVRHHYYRGILKLRAFFGRGAEERTGSR